MGRFVIFWSAFFIAIVNIQGFDKLPFAFYTTSGCKDSNEFIREQVYPVYQEYGNYMETEFVPWGKTQREPNGSIVCQYGPADCFGNRLQNCAFLFLDTDYKKNQYMNCEANTLSALNQSYYCVNKADVSDDLVKNCMETSLGDQVEQMAELKSNLVPIYYLPTVVFNNTYDFEVQNLAITNFRKLVCNELEKQIPNICK